MADDDRVKGTVGEGADRGSKPLSDHDRAVLSQVFNPTLPIFEDEPQMVDEDEEIMTSTQDPTTDAERAALMRRRQQIETLELEGVRAVEEGGDPQLAVELFSRAIEMDENRASAYNNRAQAYRLLAKNQGAEADLDKAIELSRGQGRSASQAYTQRALIRKLQGKDELAMEDFDKAAALGSHFSRAQVACMNPYAAMCNAMMTEMMEKIRRGQINS